VKRLTSGFIVAFSAAGLNAAEMREVPRLPDAGLSPLVAPQTSSIRLELVPLLQSLATIPTLAPAREAPIEAGDFVQLSGLAASLSSPKAGVEPGALLGSFWEGVQPVAPGEILEVVKPRQAATVADVVRTAWESPTARGVLRAAEKLAKRSGARVPVVLRPLGNNYGEYDYVDRILYINRDLAASDIKEAAATLVHELVHVLQHTRNIPGESLEMELEAHVITLRVLDELGVAERDRGGFSIAAAKSLRESPEAYVKWMAGQLPGKVLLAGADFDQLADDLEAEADELQERIDRLKSPAAKARAEAQLAAVHRDLDIVRSPDGQKRCRAFAQHVKRILADFTGRD